MQTPINKTEQGLSLNITIRDPLGLHARPAAKLAQKIQLFDADVQAQCGLNKADAKSVMDLLTLGAINGSELLFYAKGNDAPVCLAHIAEFFSTES